MSRGHIGLEHHIRQPRVQRTDYPSVFHGSLLRKVSKLLQQIRDLFTLIEYTKPYTLKQQLNF
jgi:hypothetical protein